MRASALLEVAAQLLRQVLKFDAPADAAVSAYFRHHRALGPRERHALAETVYAVLRGRRLFEHLAGIGQGEPGAQGAVERRLAILGWRGSAEVLRTALTASEAQWLGQADAIDRATLPPHLRHNLPDWLADSLQNEYGAEFWPLVESLHQPAPLDLRVNVLKAGREDVQAALAAHGIESRATPWSPLGLRVSGKPALEKLDSYLAGDFEVQDEGSQLLALITGARRGETVADFCAGAGGKTLLLGAAMRNTGRLYAFDTSGHRQSAMQARLARSGLTNVHTALLAHERDQRLQRLAGKIDRVLVDAPCSGLGTLRRNPDLKWRMSPQSIAELRTQQAAILEAAASLVKPGGRLVYATCSLLAAENEDIARAFAESHAGFLPLAAGDALRNAHVATADEWVQGDCLRLVPHLHATDGFFAALWERRG